MSRGGRRPGAGRKRGTPNRATAAKAAEVSASGLAPLDYMLAVMRDKTAEPRRRDDMARSAAPYVHPRLAVAVIANTAESAASAAFAAVLKEAMNSRCGLLGGSAPVSVITGGAASPEQPSSMVLAPGP